MKHVLCSLAAGTVAVCVSASQLVLCERGKTADAAIVLPEEPGPSVRYAAAELQRCIRKMPGAKKPAG